MQRVWVRVTAVAWLLAVCLAAAAHAQTRTGIYLDCLWEGSPEIRGEDTPALLDAGFDLFASQLRPQALDATSVDGRWLESLKGKAQVLLIPNTLPLAQTQQLLAKYPGLFFGYHLADDANTQKPAELQAQQTAARPFLGALPAYITLAKGSKPADYPNLWPKQQTHVQNYLGKAAYKGDGIKRFAYDEMLVWAAAVGPEGVLIGAAYPGRHTTPYFLRRDPVFRAQEFAQPATQEAVIWLQLMAGARHIVYYTAYSISNVNPLFESRLAERWDMLAAYKLINGRVKDFDSYLSAPDVARTSSVVGSRVIGVWTKPTGAKLTVTVDLASELYPRMTWVESLPPPPPVAGSFRFTVEGSKLKVQELP